MEDQDFNRLQTDGEEKMKEYKGDGDRGEVANVDYWLPVLLVQKIIALAWFHERSHRSKVKLVVRYRWMLSLGLVCKRLFQYVSQVLFTNISFENVQPEERSHTEGLFIKISKTHHVIPQFSSVTSLTFHFGQHGFFPISTSLVNLTSLVLVESDHRGDDCLSHLKLLYDPTDLRNLTKLHIRCKDFPSKELMSTLALRSAITDLSVWDTDMFKGYSLPLHITSFGLYDPKIKYSRDDIHSFLSSLQHVRHLKLGHYITPVNDISFVSKMASLETLTIKLARNTRDKKRQDYSSLFEQALKCRALSTIILYNYVNEVDLVLPSQLKDYEVITRCSQHNLYISKIELDTNYSRNRYIDTLLSALRTDIAFVFSYQAIPLFCEQIRDLTTFRYVYDRYRHLFTSCKYNVYLNCSTAGSLEIIEFLETNGFTCSHESLVAAAKGGHLEVLKHICTQYVGKRGECTAQAIDKAAAGGWIDVVKFLSSKRSEGCTELAIDMAARSGELALVEFLVEQRTEGCTSKALENACDSGHLDIVRYLTEKKPELVGSDQMMMNAASQGNLEMVVYLDKHRSEGCTEAAMNRAARGGHLDVIQYLDTHRTEGCTEDAYELAAENGHHQVLDYLWKNRTERPQAEALTSMSPFYHQRELAMVKFVHSLPVEIGWKGNISDAITYAVHGGNLELVKYLVAKHPDVELPERLLENVIRNGDIAMLEYVESLNPVVTDIEELMNIAVRCSYHLDVIRHVNEMSPDINRLSHLPSIAAKRYYDVFVYLYNEGYEAISGYGNILSDASSVGNFKLVRFLIENVEDIPVIKAVENACVRGNYEIVEYILSVRGNGCITKGVFTAAIEGGHSPIARLLLKRHRGGSKKVTTHSLNLTIRTAGAMDTLAFVDEIGSLVIDQALLVKSLDSFKPIPIRWLLDHPQGQPLVDALSKIAADHGYYFLETANQKVSTAMLFYVMVNCNIYKFQQLFPQIGSGAFQQMLHNAVAHSLLPFVRFILKYLPEDFVFDSGLIEQSLNYGNIELAQLLYDKGCRHGNEVLQQIIDLGSYHVIKWMTEHSLLTNIQTAISLDICARSGQKTVVDYVIRHYPNARCTSPEHAPSPSISSIIQYHDTDLPNQSEICNANGPRHFQNPKRMNALFNAATRD
eukprot:gene7789-9138_t